MPNVRRIIPWTTKPPFGIGLNWASPYAHGLQAYFAFNEGGGNPINLVGNTPTTVFNGPGTWGSSQSGMTLNAPSNTFYTCPGSLASYPNCTLILVGSLSALPTNTGRLLNTSTDGYGLTLASCTGFGSGTLCILFGGSAWCLPTTPIFPPPATPVFLGVTTPSTASSTLTLFYMQRYDTGAVSSSGTTNGGGQITGNGFFGLNGYPGFYGNSMTTTFLLGLVYNRLFTLNDFNALAANPWQICQPTQGQWLARAFNSNPYTFSAGGQAITGGSGGTTFPISSPAAGLAISGVRGGTGATAHCAPRRADHQRGLRQRDRGSITGRGGHPDKRPDRPCRLPRHSLVRGWAGNHRPSR